MRVRNEGWIGPTLGVLTGLWLTSGAWGPAPPAGDDVMALVVRIEDGLRVLGDGRLDGWSSSFLTGHPQFLHYGPGLAVAAAVLRVLSAFQLSVPGVLSVLFVLSYLAITPAVAFLGRGFGLRAPAAWAAGVLALAVNSPYGIGLSGLYETGLVAHSLAAPFVCVAIGAAVRIVGEPERRRWPALLAVSLAIVIVTHVVSMLIAPILGAVCVTVAAAVRRRGAWMWPLVGGVAGAAGLAAFWLVPYVRHFGERGDVSAWPTPSLLERTADIVAGRIVFPAAWFAWAVLAGWIWLLAAGRKHRPLLLAATIAPVVLLAATHALHVFAPGSEVGAQLANRSLGYAGLLAVIPLAGFVADLIERAPRVPRPDLVTVAAAVLLLLAVSNPLRAVARQQPAPHRALVETADTLRRVVPVHARFATERDYPKERDLLGVPHPDFWLAAVSGRNTVNTFGVELSASPDVRFLTEFLATGHELVDTSAEVFSRHGVTHIVTFRPATSRRLLDIGGVRAVARHGPLTVLEVLAPPGQAPPGSLLTVDHGTAIARVTHWSGGGEVLSIGLDTSTLSTASVAIGWGAAWRATLDGHRIPVLRRPDGLIGVTLPGGRHDLVLRYRPARADSAGQLISVAAFVAGLWWLRPPRRADQRQTR